MSAALACAIHVLAAIEAAPGSAVSSPGDAFVRPADFGAVADGVTDDTAPLRAAIQAASERGKIVLIGPGTYLTEPLNLGLGQIVRGAGKRTTVLQSRSGRPVFEITSAASPRSISGYVHSIEIADLGVRGVAEPWYPGAPYARGDRVQNGSGVYECIEAGTTAASDGPSGTGLSVLDGAVRWKWLKAVVPGGHGIYFHDNGGYGGPGSIDIRNVAISDVAGHGLFMKEEWCTTLENVETDRTGGNGIDIQGGNTTTLIRCYVHQVGPGRAGYRIHGSAAMISCNGVDNPKRQTVDWAVLGDDPGDGDPAWSYSFATLTNCNVEDFTHRGVAVKSGGAVWIQGGAIMAPKDGTVVGLEVGYSSDASSIIAGSVRFMSKGAQWSQGAAIHALKGAGSPVLRLGASNQSGMPERYFSPNIGTPVDIPTITGHWAGYVNGAPRASIRLNAATLDDVVAMRLKGKVFDSAPEPPRSGRWSVGDMVWNSAPTAGGAAGWMCVEAGMPGTWKAMASLAK